MKQKAFIVIAQNTLTLGSVQEDVNLKSLYYGQHTLLKIALCVDVAACKRPFLPSHRDDDPNFEEENVNICILGF